MNSLPVIKLTLSAVVILLAQQPADKGFAMAENCQSPFVNSTIDSTDSCNLVNLLIAEYKVGTDKITFTWPNSGQGSSDLQNDIVILTLDRKQKGQIGTFNRNGTFNATIFDDSIVLIVENLPPNNAETVVCALKRTAIDNKNDSVLYEKLVGSDMTFPQCVRVRTAYELGKDPMQYAAIVIVSVMATIVFCLFLVKAIQECRLQESREEKMTSVTGMTEEQRKAAAQERKRRQQARNKNRDRKSRDESTENKKGTKQRDSGEDRDMDQPPDEAEIDRDADLAENI